MTLGSHDTLAVHLEGIHKAMLSLALHLSDDESAREVRAQLEWSASHLDAAIRVLHGERDRAATERPSSGASTEEGRRSGPSEGLRGHTQAITIPEVLGFVASLRKCGVLRVKTAAEAFLIQLDQGEVIYAVGDNPPQGERLGELLIGRGQISIDALESVLASGVDEGAMLGTALVQRGLVTPEQLRCALRFQVQSIFHRVFCAEDAIYQFDEGVALRVPADIRLNVTSLLLESARSSDEGLRRVG